MSQATGGRSISRHWIADEKYSMSALDDFFGRSRRMFADLLTSHNRFRSMHDSSSLWYERGIGIPQPHNISLEICS